MQRPLSLLKEKRRLAACVPRLIVLFVDGKQRGARYEVVVAAFDEGYALGRAAGFADILDAEPDKLGLLRDDHYLAVFIHWERRHDLAGLFGRFHVDNAGSAAFGQTIAVNG